MTKKKAKKKRKIKDILFVVNKQYQPSTLASRVLNW